MMHFQDGRRLYLVKWQESWENEEELLPSCKDLLHDFWQRKLERSEDSEKEKEVKVSHITLDDIFRLLWHR